MSEKYFVLIDVHGNLHPQFLYELPVAGNGKANIQEFKFFKKIEDDEKDLSLDQLKAKYEKL